MTLGKIWEILENSQAFIQDETEESYLWLLKCLKHTNIEPKTIITDSETAMIGALQEELPNTFHVICIYHLSQNLSKQLKSILGKDYIKFLNDFYTACNSISEDIFEYQWKRLQAKYLQAENYLTNTLYIRQKYPGHIVIFTSDMQSTQRIFNGQIHYSQPHIVATVFSEGWYKENLQDDEQSFINSYNIMLGNGLVEADGPEEFVIRFNQDKLSFSQQHHDNYTQKQCSEMTWSFEHLNDL
ncbi:unnamed protein product [Rhizophagus irregularis]|uniref:MULE transposase domain-containing protein n=1 Tax=Rhizophagus irregularis TaxID=588596 RepID=A0A915Z1B5_9GLOM|nr:unnamed protein product [Rhizophagus irregularis]